MIAQALVTDMQRKQNEELNEVFKAEIQPRMLSIMENSNLADL